MSFARRFVLIAVSSAAVPSAAVCISTALFGDETAETLGQALDLVHQVENPSGKSPIDAQQIDLLTQAITAAQSAPNHRLKGHRVLAIQAIKTAIAEMRTGDKDNKAAGYLRTADSELNTAISMASALEPSRLNPGSSIASPANLASNSTPNPPAPPSQVEDAGTIPPEVTSEMEEAFLAKYKAALERQDVDALVALVAQDPHADGQTQKQVRTYATIGMIMESSNPNRTYEFIPAKKSSNNPPTVFDGKMYVDYLPAVVALKTTYTPKATASSHDLGIKGSTVPLCIQNHQLMLIGLKELGAAPPAKKADNFGLTPNLHNLDESAKDPDAFASLSEFLANLKQPNVEVMASGQDQLVYYAVCRIQPDLCIYAEAGRPGEANYSSYVHATDAGNQEIKPDPTWITLVATPAENGSVPSVQGVVFKIPAAYKGPITVEAEYRDSTGTKSSPVRQTVAWK